METFRLSLESHGNAQLSSRFEIVKTLTHENKLPIELQGITTGGWMLAARVSFGVKYTYGEKF